MEKVKEIISAIVIVLCLTWLGISYLTEPCDNLPIANYESETGFYYTYE